MDLQLEHHLMMTRRRFFGRIAGGIGGAALASLVNPGLLTAKDSRSAPHFPRRAKHVIYLFQSGAPSQIETFDYKPRLNELHGTELPESVRKGQRLTTMTSEQESLPLARAMVRFSRHGQCGAWVSDYLPYTARVVDELAIIKSLHTESINHDPGMALFFTGHEQPGRPSLGAWVTYGIGSESDNLPAFVVLVSTGTADEDFNPIAARNWGSAFLPSHHQGVRFRSSGDPVLYLSNPEGLSAAARRRMLNRISKMNQIHFDDFGDPEITARIAQYELAYRMQTAVPELVDLSGESEHTLSMYGPDTQKPGTYAANCLLARRLVERGVRFVQLYHRGWDHHNDLPVSMAAQCKDTDQPTAALISDLRQRGLLDETLIVWASEFGRTVYCQGELTHDNYGRDHHPRCFTAFMAGGGIQGGTSYGQTDDFSYNVVDSGVHVHDLNATILHCLGLDHEQLTFKHLGRENRLTDVYGNVVYDILA